MIVDFKKQKNPQHKKVFLSVLLLFSIGLTGLYAQNKLYVKEKAGTQTSFTINNVRKLTFASGNMMVNKTDKSTSAYALSNTRYLSFRDFTTDVPQISLQESSNLILFPNPVTDQLQISYETMSEGTVQVAIFDVQGKVLLQQNLSSQTGSNHATIPILQLTKGLYMFRLQNGNKLETLKFLKN